MEPVGALLSILAIFLILALFAAHVDGVSVMAPRSTRGVRASAQVFCTDHCRSAGECPLTGSAMRASDCPLWKYIDADVPTQVYGSPFDRLKT